jgi:hypothetical protein
MTATEAFFKELPHNLWHLRAGFSRLLAWFAGTIGQVEVFFSTSILLYREMPLE